MDAFFGSSSPRSIPSVSVGDSGLATKQDKGLVLLRRLASRGDFLLVGSRFFTADSEGGRAAGERSSGLDVFLPPRFLTTTAGAGGGGDDDDEDFSRSFLALSVASW